MFSPLFNYFNLKWKMKKLTRTLFSFLIVSIHYFCWQYRQLVSAEIWKHEKKMHEWFKISIEMCNQMQNYQSVLHSHEFYYFLLYRPKMLYVKNRNCCYKKVYFVLLSFDLIGKLFATSNKIGQKWNRDIFSPAIEFSLSNSLKID